MPRCTDISSSLVVGAGILLAGVPTGSISQPPRSDWTLACRPGEDGFAANCTATRAAGDFTLKLQTADSQVFVSILHPRCDTGFVNFDRTELIGRDPAERRALIIRAFYETKADIIATCRGIGWPPLELDAMPDIAILSPDMDH